MRDGEYFEKKRGRAGKIRQGLMQRRTEGG